MFFHLLLHSQATPLFHGKEKEDNPTTWRRKTTRGEHGTYHQRMISAHCMRNRGLAKPTAKLNPKTDESPGISATSPSLARRHRRHQVAHMHNTPQIHTYTPTDERKTTAKLGETSIFYGGRTTSPPRRPGSSPAPSARRHPPPTPRERAGAALLGRDGSRNTRARSLSVDTTN